MWNKPWSIKEGFTIGAGLIILGLMLQISVGPIAWNYCRWPVNIILLAVFVAIIAIFYIFRHKVYFFNFIGTLQSAVPTIVYAVILTLILGLTRQTVDGEWLNDMLSFWPFVLIYVYLDFTLGIVIIKQCHTWFLYISKVLFSKNKIVFPYSRLFSTLFHLGLFLTLTCATLGNADMHRLKTIVYTGRPEWRAMDSENRIRELNITFELKKFTIETYEDGTPKRYASDLTIYTPDGQTIDTTIEVNHPFKYKGWKIYQSGYDPSSGPFHQSSILELIKDPWLPWVYTGVYIMLAGAVFMFLFSGKNPQNNKSLAVE